MIHIRIKQERLRLNLTQEEVAQKINIKSNAFAFYEQGRRRPDYETLIKLADVFDCSVDYLIGRTDSRTEIVRQPNKDEALVVLSKDSEISPALLKEYIEQLRNLLKPKQ